MRERKTDWVRENGSTKYSKWVRNLPKHGKMQEQNDNKLNFQVFVPGGELKVDSAKCVSVSQGIGRPITDQISAH